MKKLVFFPSEPIYEYIKKGRTYEFLDEYYNPGFYFDEVYCLSPWGDKEEETIGKIKYIKAEPKKFARIIKEINPDAVRGYGGYCCADWISISKVKGIPTVVSVHDTNPDLIHSSLKYADAIICMSEAVKRAVLKKIKYDTKKMFVMPNRIDVNLFQKRIDSKHFRYLNNRFGIGKKHILHIGRKAEQKNLSTVIRALNYLPEDYMAVFVGRGDCDKYFNEAKQQGVLGRCSFVETVPNDELPIWYSWCDCFCTPSRWEGFGYVFVEAAACEAIIVTSNIAPMNEYLTNGIDSILVDDYNEPTKIAEAIILATSQCKEVEEMKKKARLVGLRFEKKEIDKKEIEIYEQVMRTKANNKINYKMKLACSDNKMVKGLYFLYKKMRKVKRNIILMCR